MGTRVIVQTTDAQGLVTVEVVSFRTREGRGRDCALELMIRNAVWQRTRRELGCSGWEVL